MRGRQRPPQLRSVRFVEDNQAQMEGYRGPLASPTVENNEAAKATILISGQFDHRPQNWPAQRDGSGARCIKGLTTPEGRNRKRSTMVQLAEAIRLIRLEAPRSIQAGQPIRLRCLYETRGDKLQSLSWYRNGREFYRFQPYERRQPIIAFNLTGIQVDVSGALITTRFLFAYLYD